MISERIARVRWRANASRLVTVMAVCFGLTVVITRLYLMSAGYPKIGGHTYHIAHALFGGVLLVLACMLTLLFAGRGVTMVVAVLSGVGLGLFIDEVGKFITVDNNYFFPLAAPIIYLVFLAVVVIARYTARHHTRQQAHILSDVIEQLAGVIGKPVQPDRKATLTAELESIDPRVLLQAEADLFDALSGYLRRAPETAKPSLTSRLARLGARVEAAMLPRNALRTVLIAVMIAHALWSLTRLLVTVVLLATWHPGRRHLFSWILEPFEGHGWKSLVGLIIAAALELAVGVAFAAAAVEWRNGDEYLALRLGVWASIVSLTVVNVLASYFDQFVTVYTAIAEAALLWFLVRYRSRFNVDGRDSGAGPERGEELPGAWQIE